MSAALVTGGASGIGAAVVRRLRADGWEVTVADVQDDLGEALATEVGATYQHLDVTDPGSWDGVLAGMDLVHLNAGVVTGEGDIAQVSEAQYRRVLDVNVDGVFLGMREAHRSMPDGAAVVVTASVAGIFGFAGDPIYTLTKHAVVGLVRALGGSRLRVNAVCPGIVDTPLLAAEIKPVLDAAGIALIEPATVADAVVAAARSGRSGECWTVLAGRAPEPFAFAPVPF